MGEGHGDYVTTKWFLKSFQVSCHPFPAVLQDSPWQTALSTPVLETGAARSRGFDCQRRRRVSRPFSPIRGGEAARSPAFCRNEEGCAGLVGLPDGGGELGELGGRWHSPAIRRGRICSPEQLAPWLAPPALLQPPRTAGGEMGTAGPATHLRVPRGCHRVPTHILPVSALSTAVFRSHPAHSSPLPRPLLRTDGKNSGSSLRTLFVLGDRSLGAKAPSHLPSSRCPATGQGATGTN